MRHEASSPGHDKTASISIFLLEELGDARVRCAQLKKYLDDATELIEKSESRDNIFEVAGHLIHGIPEVVFKLEKALEAASLAANRIDSEEVKQRLKPEKLEELEKALEDVRIRQLKRRSGEPVKEEKSKPAEQSERNAMNAKTAAQELITIAEHVEATGQVPLHRLIALTARLEQGRRTASVSGADPRRVGAFFRTLAAEVLNPPGGERVSRIAIAQRLRPVLADQMPVGMEQAAAQIYQQANSREDVMKGFKESNPSMTDDQLEAAADNWEKHKDVVKDMHG